MGKVNHWRAKMNRYYSGISTSQLKQDLESSGFRVLYVGENYNKIRSTISMSVTGATVITENSMDEDLFIELNTGAIVAK